MASMPPTRINLPESVTTGRMIAVLRADTGEHIVEVARVLEELGVRCVEVTLTTPGALDAICELAAAARPGVAIGAGTVLDVPTLEDAHEAGATFSLSPVADPEVTRRATQIGIAHVPGAATPTEILTAWQDGAAAVKVFPAHSLGGPSFIKSVRDPLPDIPLIPTGGVAADQVSSYLGAGAVAVGVGSPLTGESLATGPTPEFRERAGAFLESVRLYSETAR